MTLLRPPTPTAPAEGDAPPPPEVLFKEARRRRRRRWIAGALCVTVVGVGAGMGTWVLSSSPGPSRPASQRESTPRAALGPPPCRLAQLGIGVSGSTGAAIDSGVVLSYTDTSTRSCRLEGYPGVTGVTATIGTEVTARDELGGYLGGLSGKSAFIRVPPTLVLRGRGAAASSMVEWSSVGTYTEVSPRCLGVGHHAMVLDELRIRVDGGSPRVVETPATTPHGFGAVCDKLRADPYVPGTMGKWDPTVPTEYDRAFPTERVACRPSAGCDVSIPTAPGTKRGD